MNFKEALNMWMRKWNSGIAHLQYKILEKIACTNENKCWNGVKWAGTKWYWYREELEPPWVLERKWSMVEVDGRNWPKRCCRILRKGTISFGYLFIHSFSESLMIICYISGTVLGSGVASVKGIPVLMEFILYWKRKHPLSAELHYQCQALVFRFLLQFWHTHGFPSGPVQFLSSFSSGTQLIQLASLGIMNCLNIWMHLDSKTPMSFQEIY